MNCQRSMSCPRCGSTMTFRKFFDYGGHSWAWECTSCRQIIDEAQEIHPSPQEDRGEKWKWREVKGL